MSYQPAFDIDRKYGEEAESTLRSTLEMDSQRIEVKRKRRADEWFYVELEHSPGATGAYTKSGLNVTKAEVWAFNVGETGVTVLVPTLRLKRLLLSGVGRRAEETDGSCPTRGRLVQFRDLLS